MNRRAFLTGLLSATALPALPSTPASQWIWLGSNDATTWVALPAPLTALQMDISNRVAEIWRQEIADAFGLTRQEIADAFGLTMRQCGMEV